MLKEFFVTRSVRRLPTPFVLEPLGEIKTSPWDHGYASLGHRMLYSKNLSPPLAVSMPMIDVDAEHVKTYAATHVSSDSDREDPLEAGNETGEAKASNTADTAIGSGSMDAPGPATSQKRGEANSPALPGSPKMQRVEMTSQQHRGTTPWILQASEPQRLRGLNILQINNECFR